MEKYKKISKGEILLDQFYKFPKWLDYLSVSPTVKLTYMYIKDRYNLSLTNNWIDDDDNIYCYFTRKSLATKMNVGERTVINAIKSLQELELLIVVRQPNKPSKIYLLEATKQYIDELYDNYKSSFIEDDTDNLIEEEKTNDKNNRVDKKVIHNQNKKVIHKKVRKGDIKVRKCRICISASAKSAFPEVQNLHPNKTNTNKTNINKTNTIIHSNIDNENKTTNTKHSDLGMKDSILLKIKNDLENISEEYYEAVMNSLTIIEKAYKEKYFTIRTKTYNQQELKLIFEAIDLDILIDTIIRTRKPNIKNFEKYFITSLIKNIENLKLSNSFNKTKQIPLYKISKEEEIEDLKRKREMILKVVNTFKRYPILFADTNKNISQELKRVEKIDAKIKELENDTS